MSTQSPGLTLADVAAHYDELDRFYREIWGEHVHHGLWATRRATPEQATRHLIEVVAEQARIGRGDRVCDVGCGYGGTARALARDPGARVTALTISRAQHEYGLAVEPGSPNPAYLLRDWLDSGLESSAFDAVIAIESSEHMADLGAFFDEASRVLRPGGRLVVCAWLTRERLFGWERRRLIGPICREGRLRGMEPASTYRRLGQVAGLEPVAFRDASRQVRRTWPICAGRMAVGLVRKPSYRRFLLDGGPNRVFALTLFRIWIAYRTGAMRYGILTFRKAGEHENGDRAADGT